MIPAFHAVLHFDANKWLWEDFKGYGEIQSRTKALGEVDRWSMWPSALFKQRDDNGMAGACIRIGINAYPENIEDVKQLDWRMNRKTFF